MQFRLVMDVDDMEKAIRFYTSGLGLSVGRRFDAEFVELTGGPAPIDLLMKPAGTPANQAATRTYERHWTPVHLDFVVDDCDATVRRLVSLGATLEAEPKNHAYGRLALLADPFGHGLCVLQLNERGYDALLD